MMDEVALFWIGLACGAALAFALCAWPFLNVWRRATLAEAREAGHAETLPILEEQLRRAAQVAMQENADRIGIHLKDLSERLVQLDKTHHGLTSQLQIFADDQRHFRQQTGALIQALKNPAARGKWGEMQLNRALELVGLREGVHYKQQVSVTLDGRRAQPDFVVTLPGGLSVVIDVKTPLDPYWETLDSPDSDPDRTQAMEAFRQNVRAHVKHLSSKDYWRSFDSAEFVVMFLPTEGLYSLALTLDRDLIEQAAEQRIILASPTTIMGLLRIIAFGWQQQRMADDARVIADLGHELYTRFGAFGDHMAKLGRHMGSAIAAYNQAVGSLEAKVLPQLRRFKELRMTDSGENGIEQLSAIDTLERPLSAPEFLTRKDEAA